MIRRKLLLLTLLGLLTAAAPAAAAYTVGIGDQSPALFQNPHWQALKLQKVRYLVPWNALSDPAQRHEIEQYMAAARAARQEVLVHFTSVRGCWNGRAYSRSRPCRAPSVAAYTKAFKAFKRQFRYVNTYGAWNEANHVSQPVYKNPRRAAQYYLALKRNCKRCKVIAGDLLDSSNLRGYAKAMLRVTKRKAKLWGLHNYSDVNRLRSVGTTTLLKTVPGEVWVTETGGIVRFTAAKGLAPSESNAVKAVSFMFSLAAKYDTRRRRHKSRLTRLYPYDFGPSPADARFDASLLAPDGTPRPAYATFLAQARTARK